MTTLTRLLLGVLLALLVPGVQAVDRVTYYHNDALGSPVVATNQRGEVVWRRSYTPYGEELNREAPNEPGYTGKIEEPDLGISDFGARWYDPRIGRFLAIDPVGFSPENPQSFNRYAYANNNPYRYVDPDGNIPVDTIWDIANVIADIGTISAGLATDNPALVRQGATDLALDAAATLVPYLPAGASKLVGATGDVAKGAKDAAIELTTEGERFVRVGAAPENLKFTFETPGGVQPGTYAFPEQTFLKIGSDPVALKNLGDLPGTPPQYSRTLEPPAGTPIQRGVVPGGEFGGEGGVREVKFPEGF